MTNFIHRTAQAFGLPAAEIETLQTPEPTDVGPKLQPGSKAPSTDQLRLPNGKKTLVVFLRHCGCPFAEKTFRSLATISAQPDAPHCIAVFQSTPDAVEAWVPRVGGAWSVDTLSDPSRGLFARWGLGTGSVWQTMGPTVLWSVWRLGQNEGTWNRPAQSGSGSRWQMSGAFAVDGDGTVRWAHVDGSADDVPDLKAAAASLGFGAPKANL